MKASIQDFAGKSPGERHVPAAAGGRPDDFHMAHLFREALSRCLDGNGSPSDRRAIRALERRFLSSVTRLENAQRGAREANTVLCRVNDLLEAQISRIAGELHAEAGQLLASVYLALDEVGRELPPDLRGRLAKVRGLLDLVQEQFRRISHELRPTILDELGLLPALRFLCAGVAERSGLRITIGGSGGRRLPPRVETTLYRVVQEALNNAARHARASRVTVRLRCLNTRIRCSIHDDGVGMDRTPPPPSRAASGVGLKDIRVRLEAVGGSLRIRTRAGFGTELIATIPREQNG